MESTQEQMTVTIQAPAENPKKSAKKDFNRIGMALLFMLVLSLAISFFISLFVGILLSVQYTMQAVQSGKALNFAKEQTELAARIKSMVLLIPIVLLVSTLVANTLPFFIYIKKLKVNAKAFFAKPNVKNSTTAVYCGVALGVSSAASYIVEGLDKLLSLVKLHITSPDLSIPMNSVPAAIIMIFCLVILAPVTEEIIFRGLVLNAFKKYGAWFAVITSSLLWAVIHGDLVQAIPVFFMGIFLGTLALKSGSILPTIAIHVINNLLSSVINIFAAKFPAYSNQIQGGTDILFILTAIVLLLLFHREFGVNKENEEKPRIKRYKTFFSSWSIILTIIVCALITVIGYITPVK